MKELNQNNNNILREVELFKLLELPSDVSKEEIRRAYRRISKKHHPDVGGNSEMFASITEAYNILTDDKRREYFNLTGSRDFMDPKRVKEDAVKSVESLFYEILKISNYNILQIDMINVAETKMNEKIQELKRNIISIEAVLKQLDKASSKTTVVEGKKNLILLVIEKGKKEQRQAILESEKVMAILMESKNIINEQNFNFEQYIPKESVFTITMGTAFNQF